MAKKKASVELTAQGEAQLMRTAEEMSERAYAPYSGFKVGAAILSDDGRVFTGCNVENGSYGCCICAERTAAVKAVSEGALKFRAAAVANAGGGLTYPCGICLQFMSEFAEDGFCIIMREKSGTIVSHPIEELLPRGFKLR
ncbi:MAG: cytidine deaminase [Oscillospiraceae bacterium]|nr:cytidine deaminase [Oscillospiraceae bacterium]